ncbi:MAG: DUF4038 domain-containing protein [Saprospiraceae bacterium]|nr:DUF4038 domain-containing protein [Saprospiraceae bacterium]
MIRHHFFTCLLLMMVSPFMSGQVTIWNKAEFDFRSNREYDNALYDVRDFSMTLTSPTGRELTVPGFWDGGLVWKVRFMPDEVGDWQAITSCSDESNDGLHGQVLTFEVLPNERTDHLRLHGAVTVRKGDYHFSHADATPFFWTACTAWNGALKSTEEEWQHYLTRRVDQGYNTIQYVTTEWRGAEANAEGVKSITGSGRIQVNPEFFKRIDQKTDAINAKGLLAAPVVLWALPKGDGRHLSPGYYLPNEEAVLLARYIVARLQGNHVCWLLGGDGNYLGELEGRWKYIGKEVFGNIHHAPVTLHPGGHRWIGDVYQMEDWYDIYAYQSSHSNRKGTVDWITQGPMAHSWHLLPPKPIINMEPNYEEMRFELDAEDVRNASYWSILATPLSGITYGANGIWPWIQEVGDTIENHFNPVGRFHTPWRESIEFPGSQQVGHLARIFMELPWTALRPAQSLLHQQPGISSFNHFISVAATPDQSCVIAYVPRGDQIRLRITDQQQRSAEWINPRTAERLSVPIKLDGGLCSFDPPEDSDWILLLLSR